MNQTSDEPSLKALQKATQKAEEAAAKAEKAAKPPRYLLVVGLLFAIVGAVLALALDADDPSALGVRLEPLGGVLFALGVLLLAGGALGSVLGNGGEGGGMDASGLKSIGGLIAVITGITAVTALTIVTLTQLGGETDSIVAVTSSAFGIISAVTGAYLGIKITAETSAKSSDKANQEAKEEAQNAAVAEHRATLADRKFEGAAAAADKTLDPAAAQKIKDAGVAAAAEAARPPDPPAGSGAA